MTETMSAAAHRALSENASRIPGSGIREIFNLALGRSDVLHLEVGEPDFDVPAHIVDAAFASARAGSGYTSTVGVLEVREAAAGRLERVHGLQVDPAHVLITQGGAQAFSIIVAACVSPGDEVLIPDPAWPNYAMSVAAFGGTVVRYPLRPENGLNPDPDEVAALITPRTKLLVLNSPGNPTGAVAPPDDLERLVTLARSAGVLVVSDEVYDEIVFDGLRPHTLVPIDPDWVVGLWSCSKTYAMTGWRVGYTAVPASIVGALTRIQESMITCVSSVTQAAALAAFTGPQECVAEMYAAYQRRRDLLMGLLEGAGIGFVRPQGAFYLMMSLADGANGRLAALDLVDNGVAVAPGTAFGDVASSALRISLAASEETITAAAEKLIYWYNRTDAGRTIS